jgi:NAD(P)H-hydrate epimerase
MEVAQKRKPHFGTVVATPHMGEFIRIAKLSDSDFSIQTQLDVSKFYRIMTVLKGPNTRICDGDSVIYSTHGGPVLSRGGSGDILAGLLGGIVAQDNDHVRVSVCQGVMLHGLAAERLARARGQVAVRTTQILEYISEVLREA